MTGLRKKPSENIVGKGEIACTSNFSFSHNVSFSIKDSDYHFFRINLSSANAFNLVWSEILLCGNGLNRWETNNGLPAVVVATAGWVEVADIGCLVVVGFGVVVVVVVVGVFGPGVVNAPADIPIFEFNVYNTSLHEKDYLNLATFENIAANRRSKE